MLGELDVEKLGINPQEIKEFKTSWTRAHYRAAVNWLMMYQSFPNDSNLQKIFGCLEAIHHFSIIQEWCIVSNILSLQINATVDEELYEKLYLWGYYQQLTRIYTSLVGKVNYRWDIICLSGLGNIFDVLGDHQQAIYFYEKWQKLASDYNDERQYSLAQCSLGIDLTKTSSGEIILKAFGHFDAVKIIHTSSITKRSQYRAAQNWLTYNNISINPINNILEAFYHYSQTEDWEMASALLNIRFRFNRETTLTDQLIVLGRWKETQELYDQLLNRLNLKWDSICLAEKGHILNLFGYFENAIQYLDASLDISRHIGDRLRESMILEQLGISYKEMGSSKAIDYLHDSHLIAKDIGYQVGQVTSQIELGIVYTLFEESTLALNCLNNGLNLAQFSEQKTLALYGLGFFYLNQRDFENAANYAKNQLNISNSIKYKNSIGTASYLLSDIYFKTGDNMLALKNIQSSLLIFRDLGAFANEQKAIELKRKIMNNEEQTEI